MKYGNFEGFLFFYGSMQDLRLVKTVKFAVNHANPMDTHFDIEDVEMIPLDNNKVDSDIVEIVEAAPVMDVRGLEEQEPAKEVEEEAKEEEDVTEVKELEAEELPQLPYLSVLRGDASQVITVYDWSLKTLCWSLIGLILVSHWSIKTHTGLSLVNEDLYWSLIGQLRFMHFRRLVTGVRGCLPATGSLPRGNTWTLSAVTTTCEYLYLKHPFSSA